MRQNHPPVARQRTEQFVFCAAQLYRAPLQKDLVLGVINGQFARGENGLRYHVFARCGPSAQERAQTRQQFFHAERLYHQVIGAKIKQPYAFIFIAIIAEHDHGHLREFAQTLQ